MFLLVYVLSGVNVHIDDKKASLIALAKFLGSSPSSARCWRSAMGLRAQPLKSQLAVQFPSTSFVSIITPKTMTFDL